MSSSFAEERRKEKMPKARLLKNLKEVGWEENKNFLSMGLGQQIDAKPHTVGALFSGGPAAGGHNVIAGLYDALQELNPKNKLYGFKGGAAGLLSGNYKEITEDRVDRYRNSGGFQMLGTGRGKIETEEHFKAVAKVVHDKKLDAIVVIGGDDSNTNAYHLANYFKKMDVKCSIIGVPKTIDGDLKTEWIEASFGFDTATKVYSEMIGNICCDASSSLKYFHFIRLMGRSASHVTLECALKTHPNLTLISEEVAAKKMSLDQIVRLIADMVIDRANSGKSYGVCLLPEGIIEFIPEFNELISNLNRILAKGKEVSELPEKQKELFDSLPKDITQQLLSERDPHGNVQVSKIETEKLIYEMVASELEKRGFQGKFNPVSHFFGYEGRCSFPSFFDAAYCYNLGYVAAALIMNRQSGVMAGLSGLHKKVEDWLPIGVNIKTMMVEEERKGEMKRVIKKSVVDLNGDVFKSFKAKRTEWIVHDKYENPGPIQYSGENMGIVTKTLDVEARTKSNFV